MSDQGQTLQDDISYMRRMAEQGRRGPIYGGIFLAAAGLIFALACLVQWAMDTGRFSLSMSEAELWGGAVALFVLAWIALAMRMHAHAKASEALRLGMAQMIFGVAWASGGLGIMVMLAAIYIASLRAGVPAMMTLNTSVAFAFYGTIWFVMAALARQAWMFLAALAAFGFAIALAAAGGPGMLLVMAAGLLITLLLPGLWLMRQASF